MSDLIVQRTTASGFKVWKQECSANLTDDCYRRFSTQNPNRDVCGSCMQELKRRFERKRKDWNDATFTLDDHPDTGFMTVLDEKERWMMGLIGTWA